MGWGSARTEHSKSHEIKQGWRLPPGWEGEGSLPCQLPLTILGTGAAS